MTAWRIVISSRAVVPAASSCMRPLALIVLSALSNERPVTGTRKSLCTAAAVAGAAALAAAATAVLAVTRSGCYPLIASLARCGYMCAAAHDHRHFAADYICETLVEES